MTSVGFWRRWCAVTLVLSTVQVTLAATPASAAVGSAGTDRPAERSAHGYLRPYLGWGGPVLSDPENFPSWYRFAGGLGGGVKLSEISVGLDFLYFSGEKFTSVDSFEDPMVELDARRHAFRGSADVGYDFDLEHVVLRPHLLGGIEWRRSTRSDGRSETDGFFYWAPAVAALVPIRRGSFLVGADARAGMVLVEGAVEVQFAGFIVFESIF